jgi:hypothetical protein
VSTATASPSPTPVPDIDTLPSDALLSARQVAALMGCSLRHIRRLSVSELRPVKLGTAVRFRAGRVRDYIRGLEQRARK